MSQIEPEVAIEKRPQLNTKEVIMAKSKTIFVCNECGNESSKWLGKCPACNSWNSFFEQKVVESKSSALAPKDNKVNIPQKLNSYKAEEKIRASTGFGELDRVLGGGLVKGSLVLLRRGTRYRKVNSYSSNL